MAKLKIAFATTIPTDAVPFISAVNSVNGKLGNVVEAQIQTGGDFRAFSKLDNFIQFAQKSHITLVHLMGDLPEFELLASTLKSAKVPLFVSTSFFGQNAKYRSYSTVTQEDYQ
ncbi:MAG: hypothetical protein QXL10_02515, partial [Candidatus Bathyarchaeia archaeon]